ncbi:MAG: thiolase family protein [Rhodobacteraceae bacterium]|nr:thiolase family protein [Paracoccaceae bacterium]
MNEIVFAGGMRTPFGDYSKSLKDTPLGELGTHAAKACLVKAGLGADKIDHLVWGNVVPVDMDACYQSRTIALNTGMSQDTASLYVQRACGSGTQAILSAAQQIMTGHSKIALAGGGENSSRAPYVLQDSRWGGGRGPQTMVDSLDLAFRDPFSRVLMGETAENLTEDYDYQREDMDVWALKSQQRAGAAIESGFLARQVAPIEIKERRSTRIMEVDEFPRPTVTAEKLASLKPVFRKGGRVTAGNSSGMTDGSAFIVVADRAAAEAEGVTPLARLVDWEIVGVEPRVMGAGPVPAIDKLLKRRNMQVNDVDYYEINEAFAVVNVHAEKQLGISHDRTNLYGGGISIGHPPGATGVRMTITAIEHLKDTGQRYAIISMCMGGGQGMAVLIENIIE